MTNLDLRRETKEKALGSIRGMIERANLKVSEDWTSEFQGVIRAIGREGENPFTVTLDFQADRAHIGVRDNLHKKQPEQGFWQDYGKSPDIRRAVQASSDAINTICRKYAVPITHESRFFDLKDKIETLIETHGAADAAQAIANALVGETPTEVLVAVMEALDSPNFTP